jgi:hypothetical protein
MYQYHVLLGVLVHAVMSELLWLPYVDTSIHIWYLIVNIITKVPYMGLYWMQWYKMHADEVVDGVQ